MNPCWRMAAALLLAGVVAVDTGQADEPKRGASRSGKSVLVSLASTVVPIAAGIAIGAQERGGTGQTIASGSLVWGGAVVGPAVGYWYGGAGRKATSGLIVRGSAFALASVVAPPDDWNDGFYPNPELGNEAGMWVLASAIILASDIVDIARVDNAVGEAESPRLSVMPTYDPRAKEFCVVIATRY